LQPDVGLEDLVEPLEDLQAALTKLDVPRIGEGCPYPAERLGRRARAHGVRLDEDDVADTGLGEVEAVLVPMIPPPVIPALADRARWAASSKVRGTMWSAASAIATPIDKIHV